MKVCFIDVTHWHAPSYYRTLRELTGVAALTARNSQTGKGVAEGLGAKFYEDYREMVQRERPDFVFALGRHCEMAETARFLLEKGVPFAMEKPMGLNLKEAEELTELARAKDAFVAVPFSIRLSPWVRKVREMEGSGADFSHASFRFMSGPVSRYYENDNPWNLRLAEAGGGCLINIGIHLPDLCLHLTGKSVTKVYARNQQRLLRGGSRGLRPGFHRDRRWGSLLHGVRLRARRTALDPAGGILASWENQAIPFRRKRPDGLVR